MKSTKQNSHEQQNSAARRYGPKTILPDGVSLNWFRRWLRQRYKRRDKIKCTAWLWTKEEAAQVLRDWHARGR